MKGRKSYQLGKTFGPIRGEHFYCTQAKMALDWHNLQGHPL